MSIDRQMDQEDVIYIHNGTLLSHNNDIMPFAATWMELETLILSEVRKRKTNTIWYHLNWNLLYSINEPFHRKENHGLGEQTCGSLWGARRSGVDWELGVNGCKLLLLEWIYNEILLCSIENYVQIFTSQHNWEEKVCIHACVTWSLCCIVKK